MRQSPRLYTAAMPQALTPVLALACFSLAACATLPALEWRLLVKLAEPSTDTVAIERRASETARSPVRYVASTSPQWHALALSCADQAACEQAVERLRADTSAYASVGLDRRRGVVTP